MDVAALIISVVGLIIAGWSALSSHGSKNAADRSAKEAGAANELTRLMMEADFREVEAIGDSDSTSLYFLNVGRGSAKEVRVRFAAGDHIDWLNHYQAGPVRAGEEVKADVSNVTGTAWFGGAVSREVSIQWISETGALRTKNLTIPDPYAGNRRPVR